MTAARRLFCVIGVLLFVAASAFAQSATTGQLTGTVILDGNPIPGVTVTVASPSLQGTRTSTSDVNGNYNFGLLPPGDYSVRFEMSGMSTVNKTAKVGVNQTARADASMSVSSVAEAITVTAAAPAVLETQQIQSNYSANLIDQLPLGTGTLLATTNLAPGVTSNGVGGNTVISGAFSYDNLYMVNGVAVNENLRGQPHNLFIEDAIQETTVTTAGAISAEYGRFTGGVVNAVTKSGGNEFSGSLRDNLTNDSWTQKSPSIYRNNVPQASPEPADKTNSVYEGTFGGRIIRDRLWFFLAGRDSRLTNARNFARSNHTFSVQSKSFRYEGKLTGQITPNHTIIGSYMNADVKGTNNCQYGSAGCLDATGIDAAISNPNSFETVHYNGIFGANFLAEASYAKKKFGFDGFGGDTSDRILGTPIRDYGPQGTGEGFNAPQFNGLEPETRDSDQYTLKGTYYLGTKSFGTHNFVAGIDNWKEARKVNNNQSASDYIVYLDSYDPIQDANGNVTQVHIADQDGLGYWPVLASSKGSDFKTNSFFVNDKFDLNTHWSFNLGGRFDKLNGKDSAGNKVADDSSFSPRLGAIYDITGNGRYRLNASYSKYVARLAESIAGGNSTAGTPALFYYNYNGPDIVGTPHEVLQKLFAWFDSLGGFNGIHDPNILTFVRVPGASQVFEDNRLKSPDVDEYTFGYGMQVGDRGYFRADYINRKWGNFYTALTNQGTGTAVVNGSTVDRTIIANTDLYSRKYNAVELQANYRLFTRLNLGGNYTWSKLRGNLEGETSGSGPVSDTAFTYPEYQGFAQRAPVGYLAEDQRHKLRAWGTYDLPTPVGKFNFSVLERFDSGTPYSAFGTIDVRGANHQTLPTGFAYKVPPTTSTYYFSDRGAFRTDDVTATDVALNYEFPISRISLFAQAELVNAFNEKARTVVDASVLTSTTAACVQTTGANMGKRCSTFNPFTTAPVEGVNWVKGPNFGNPTTLANTTTVANGSSGYQLPRTYRFSFGLRF